MKFEEKIDILYQSIDEINELRLEDELINKDIQEVIIGPKGALDSMETATFLLDVETRINQKLNHSIDLVNLIMGDVGLTKDLSFSDISNLIK